MSTRKIVLSDEMVEARLESRETLQYSLELTGPIMFWKAEVIGPWSSAHSNLIGRCSFGPTSEKAVQRLKLQLERNGFIGRLEGFGTTVTGRGPHTDLVDQDPLSDDDLLAD
jgi:hypothetical protein